jgi:predicted Fe-Mo cluster-binding NifX family protein
LKVPRQCPLFLLAEVKRGEVKSVELYEVAFVMSGRENLSIDSTACGVK